MWPKGAQLFVTPGRSGGPVRVDNVCSVAALAGEEDDHLQQSINTKMNSPAFLASVLPQPIPLQSSHPATCFCIAQMHNYIDQAYSR
jgi:hypothetical protein